MNKIGSVQTGNVQTLKGRKVGERMDRESVMAWLEGLAQDDWRMFHSDSEVQEIARNALELLKEQEAVEPIPPTDESEMWRCGNCHHQIFRCRHQRFCERCGKVVKWE